MARIICPNCSSAYTPPVAGVERCPRCGYGANPVPSTLSSTSPGPTFSPVAAPPGPLLSPPGTVPAPPATASTNGFAVASLVLGIVAIPFFMLLVLSLLGLIFGIVAISQVRRKNQKGFGMAVTGIVLSSLALTVALMLWFFVTALF